MKPLRLCTGRIGLQLQATGNAERSRLCLPPSLMMRYHRPPCGYIPASSNQRVITIVIQQSFNESNFNQLAMKKLPVQFAMKIIPVQFKSPTLDSEVYKANILRYIADQKDQPRSKCLSVERELAAA